MHIAKPISSDDLVSKLAELAGIGFDISNFRVRPSSPTVTKGTGFRPTLTQG
jgi:hypothetical protein